MKEIRRVVLAAGLLFSSFLAATGCDGDDDPDGSSSSSSSGKCSGDRPEGAFKCSGSTSIQVCDGGVWKSAGACGCSVSVGDPRKPPYAATCKYWKTNSIECSYAGEACKYCEVGHDCRSVSN